MIFHWFFPSLGITREKWDSQNYEHMDWLLSQQRSGPYTGINMTYMGFVCYDRNVGTFLEKFQNFTHLRKVMFIIISNVNSVFFPLVDQILQRYFFWNMFFYPVCYFQAPNWEWKGSFHPIAWANHVLVVSLPLLPRYLPYIAVF